MKRYVVIRVGKTVMACASRPTRTAEASMKHLRELQKARPGLDYRVAQLTLPEVAPYSDYWPIS